MMYVLQKIQSIPLAQFVRSLQNINWAELKMPVIRIPTSRGAHLLYAFAISISVLGIYGGVQRAASLQSEAVPIMTTDETPAPLVVSRGPKNLGLNIAGNGLVTLRGAKVTRISGSEIRASSKWGSAEFTWRVQTTYGTKFIASSGEKMALATLTKGDYVTITGMLDQNAGDPTIKATFIRRSR